MGSLVVSVVGVHTVTRTRTLNLKIMVAQKLFLPLLVIVATCHAFPKPTEEQTDGIVHDEAQETIYEDLRDHELQDSLNGGQSGLALELISHGENPSDLWSRLKRQEMADHLEVPESTEVEPTEAPVPIVNAAYAARLEGSAIALANKLANAKRQKIERVPGYGRRKRQVKTEDEIVPESTEVEPTEAPAPIVNAAYAARLEGSAIALANKLANA